MIPLGKSMMENIEIGRARRDSYIEVLPNTKHTLKYLRVTRPRPNTKHKKNFCTKMTLNLINKPSITQTFPPNYYQALITNAMIHRDVKDGAVLQTWHCLPRANQSPCASTIPSVIVTITITITITSTINVPSGTVSITITIE